METRIKELNKVDLSAILGGRIRGLVYDAACFLVSPAFGLFNLGVKAGYREAANEDRG